MKRRLLNLLSILSLLMCVAVCVLWVRSVRRPEALRREWNDRVRSVYCQYYVSSVDGSVWMWRQWRWVPPSTSVYSIHDACERRRRERAWHGWEYLPRFSVVMPMTGSGWESAGFAFRRESQHYPARVSDNHVIAVPYWFLAAASMAPLVMQAPARARRWRRRRRNVCESCGYDLRATPGRCPECGHVAAGAGEASRV
jgi:hypothetical protein